MTSAVLTPPAQVGWLRISWVLYLACIALSFFVMIEPAPTDLVFALSFGALILGGGSRGYLVGPVVTVGLLVFMWFTILSLIFVTGFHVQAVRAVIVEIYLVLLFLMTAYFTRRWGDKAFDRITVMYIIGGVIATVIGVLAYLDLVPNREIFFRDEHLKRIKSTFKDPNVFGPFLILPLLASFWLALSSKRLMPVALTVVLATGLIIAYSRGAWVHCLISLSIFGVALLVNRQTFLRTFTLLSALSVIVVLLAVNFSDQIAQSVESSFIAQRLSFQSYDSERFSVIWAVVKDLVLNPFGIGPYQSILVYRIEPHNTFVLVALHNGIPAAIGYTVVFLAAIYRCFVKVVQQEDGWMKYAFIFSILVGLLVLSNVVSSLHWRHLYVTMGLAFGEYTSNGILERRFRQRA